MTGMRSALSSSWIYELFSSLVGGAHGRSTLVREHVRPSPGASVLDIGCGPGELVRHLGDVRYVGVDVSERYIDRATEVFGDRADFRVGDARKLDLDLRDFDLVLAFGVLHHLDDEDAKRVIDCARAALKSEGRFVSVDPTLEANDRRPLVRLLIRADRGQHIRLPSEYKRVAESAFAEVQCAVRRDLLRIPYAHCVLECDGDRAVSTP